MIVILLYYSPSEFITNCSKGLKSNRAGTLSSAYLAVEGSYEEEQWWGSFCPTKNDTQKLALKAFPKLYSTMSGLSYSYDNSGGAIRCSGDDAGGDIVYNFPSNRCYSFHMHLYTSCAAKRGKIYMDRLPVGSDTWTTVTQDYLYTCSYDDCLPGYWGSNCQYGPVTYDEGKNCYVSLGLLGNGKCTCESATEIQPYCRPGTSPGFIWNKYESTESRFISSTTISNLDSLDLSDRTPYALHIIRGKLYIPTTGNYKFRTEANTKTGIKVSTTSVNLEIKRLTTCENTKVYNIINADLNADTLYDIEIKYYSGCSVKDMYLKLTWTVPSGSEFVTIPQRYIFH